MSSRPSWYRRTFRIPFSSRQLRDDLDHELQFHLEMRTAKLIDQGMEPAAARSEAQRRFGDLRTIRRDCLTIDQQRNRIMRLETWWDELRLDVSQAFRSLLKQPTFTLTAVLALAIGIGATTTIFSLLDAVVLRPWPMPEPERVVFIAPTTAQGPHGVSPGLAVAWEERSRSLEHLAAFYEQTLNLTDDGTPERIAGRAASASYFQVLGVPASLGRVFGESDDRPESEKVAVLSHRLWSRRFGADPEILGRAVTLNGTGHTVIGVMPASLDLDASSPEILLPLALPASQRDHFGGNYLTVLGRLQDGVPPDEARQELASLVEQLDLRNATTDELYEVTLKPLGDILIFDHATRLWILFGAVLFVLLITCSNVASLLLARCASRAQELGIRASLGAGRGRIAAQLLNESLVLATAGAALGIFFAHLSIRTLIALVPTAVPRIDQAGIDGRVLAFTFLLTFITVLLFGTAPAWRSSRLDLHAVLRGGGRHSGLGDGRDRLRSIFVATQVAISLLLLTGAGLLIRSALLLHQVSPGFEAENVLTAELKLPESDYPSLDRALVTYTEILEKVNSTPGVESAALGTAVPLAGDTAGSNFALQGQPLAPGSQVQGRIHLVSPSYFHTLGVPMVAGRDLSAHDNANTARAVIVNETMARRLGVENLVGQHLYTDTYSFVDPQDQPYLWEIVGVAADIKDQGLRSAPQPAVYLALTQAPSAPWTWTGRRMLLAARTSIPPLALVADLKSAVGAVDERLPLYNVETLVQRLAGTLAAERFNTVLISSLGLIGLLLAGLGIYGLVAFFVSQRRHEMGVRIALGATAPQLHSLIILQGMGPVLIGLALGLLAAAGLASVLESQLFGITAWDPLTYIFMSLVLTALALTACYLPARQASQADPREILRAQ